MDFSSISTLPLDYPYSVSIDFGARASEQRLNYYIELCDWCKEHVGLRNSEWGVLTSWPITFGFKSGADYTWFVLRFCSGS